MAAAYPWYAFSAQTQARQKEINLLAIKAGKCPPLVEDGKMGPSTCGAAKAYAGVSANVSELLKSCQSYNDAAANGCLKLPWMVRSPETQTLQYGLNQILMPQGFCKITEDGILGPTTCAGAKKVLGAKAANLGCQQTGTLKVCAATSTPTSPISPPTIPSPGSQPPVADEPTQIPAAPNPSPTTPQPQPQPKPQPKPTVSTKKSSSTGPMIAAGALILAAGAGTYLLMKKGKKKR